MKEYIDGVEAVWTADKEYLLGTDTGGIIVYEDDEPSFFESYDKVYWVPFIQTKKVKFIGDDKIYTIDEAFPLFTAKSPYND